MARLKTLLFTSVVFFVFAVSATEEERICVEKSEQAALIVIDMQPIYVTRNGFHTTAENTKKVEEITKKQIELIDRAKERHLPIVFIEYRQDEEVHKARDTNEALKAAVKDYSNVKYIRKDSDGMFDSMNTNKAELVKYLQEKNIGHLIITGANGGACVKASISGSLKGNCKVLAFSRGIADFNYPEFIYPYAGHYNGIVPQCQSCQFEETSEVNKVITLMDKADTSHGVRRSSSKQEAGWN